METVDQRGQTIHGHQVNVGGNATIEHIGDRIEYHWHANEVPEDVQLTAIQLYSEASTTCFVDLMRLLTVRSSPLAYQHNHERYDEFVTISKLHLQDVDRQIQRFSSSLPAALIKNTSLIERQLNWANSRLMIKPEKAFMELGLFIQMQRISENIHDFCLRSKHSQYLVDWRIVREEMIDIIKVAEQPGSQIPIDDFIQLRFGTQQQILEKYKTLRTIGDDATYELSFLYFIIDCQLLLFAN